MSADNAADGGKKDLAALARGGRINFFGFVLRLLARIPFLFIAGQFYGAEALGRFAYALIVVEFSAQIATLGLKRGLAQQLSASKGKDHTHIVWDGMVVAMLGSLLIMAVLFLFPQMMFPNSEVRGLERLLPITVLALAWTEVALAACNYRHNIAATVRSRAIVEPWTISIVAGVWAFISTDDGLIVAYVASMVGALLAALWPFIKDYGLPHHWKPHYAELWGMARRNLPVAAADATEWASRRLDILVLGLFFTPAIVGIYWAAQQVASLPSKLKTSFDPIMGPVISQNVEAGNMGAVAQQVRQVGFWIIAAQAGVALALGIPAMAVMNLVGEEFGAGYIILAVLLAAEVIAAMAAVSEAALIYLARHRNMIIGFIMLALEAAIGAGAIIVLRNMGYPVEVQAAGAAIGLAAALGFAAIAKAWLLSGIVNASVSGWRWPLVWAGIATIPLGLMIGRIPDWAQLTIGAPAILLVFGIVVWRWGFGPEDRELFKMKKERPGAATPGDDLSN
ncbi:lipopolysaccharide biosynthesis protein [Sphingomicrobium aestuariivivum]|uniref:lipopolysaccharide biosynthesis protein n=1 Tax=Sphingomicrobium aestuariivivum TaxID=1582356 RepID=UPI001FD6C35C|nr:oligosaccharide flippase family protein [Sphingomicrobium aestuariivivum]MCJ8191108.1 oligosaccharide flippase family protein [Sphingomicrobium aestuariivivum]